MIVLVRGVQASRLKDTCRVSPPAQCSSALSTPAPGESVRYPPKNVLPPKVNAGRLWPFTDTTCQSPTKSDGSGTAVSSLQAASNAASTA